MTKNPPPSKPTAAPLPSSPLRTMADIRIHPQSGSTVLPILERYLPYSLPLYRRIQDSSRTEYAVILASLPTPNQDEVDCFAVCYLDRSRRPETEMFMFVSGEKPGTCNLLRDAEERLRSAKTLMATEDDSSFQLHPNDMIPTACSRCKAALRAVLTAANEQPYPVLEGQEEGDALAAVRGNRVQLDTPNTIKLGAAHEIVVAMLRELGVLRDDLSPGLIPYRKFLFNWPKKSTDTGDEKLRADRGDAGTKERDWYLRDGGVREEDVAWIRSKTGIPRKISTLKNLPSAAAYRHVFNAPADEPSFIAETARGQMTTMSLSEAIKPVIAWAFMGADGSLTSLHVEKMWQRQGLAKAITRKLFDEHVARLHEEDQGAREENGWIHADVGTNNDASRGVCLSLGGYEGWTVYWVRIEPAALRETAR